MSSKKTSEKKKRFGDIKKKNKAQKESKWKNLSPRNARGDGKKKQSHGATSGGKMPDLNI